MVNRAITLFNRIKEATAASMAHSMYVHTKYAGQLDGMYANADLSINEEEPLGNLNGIVCGSSRCGSDLNPTGEQCIKR